MILRRAAWLIAAAITPAAAAIAPTPQHTTPTRDVQVIYDLNDHGKKLTQRSAWQVATALQRVDIYGGDGTWLLEDGKHLTAAVVDDGQKRVVDAKITPGPLNGGKASFKRLGKMTIAGIACTEWQVTPQGSRSPPQQICLSADGIPLNIRTGAAQLARATRVTYLLANPSLFIVPAGYQHIQR